MKLGTGILIAVVACGAAPVLVVGWSAEREAREELTAAIGTAQAGQAAELARGVDRFVLDRLQALSLAAGYLPLDRLGPREIFRALAVPYRQIPGIEILAFLDAEGRALAPPVHGTDAPGRTLEGHERVDAAGLQAFARSVPFRAALDAGAAVGPPYLSPSTGVPRVALAVRAGARGDRVLAAELSLASVARRLEEGAGSGAAYLLDAETRPLAGSSGLSPEERDLADAGVRGASSRILRRADGRRWLASIAPVESLGWAVVLALPEESAFAGVSRLRRHGLYWGAVALAVALAIGLRLSRALSRPVERLTSAAHALREGRLDVPLPEAGPGELGELSAAFAHMAREVRRRDEEIRGWNEELRKRVERRTAELREAETQLHRSRNLAALSSLSAGIARGLNDPLTAVVGLLALARSQAGPESEQGRLVERAIGEARRVNRVVRDLRRMAEPGPAAGLRKFPVSAPAGTALARLRPAAEARGIALAMEADDPLPLIEGDPDQIETLVERLLENAVDATPSGGRVTVRLRAIADGALKLVVEDTGRGIPEDVRPRIFDPYFSTRADAGSGVGLTVAHGIVEAHHGRISVESEEGEGSRFTVVLPTAPAPPEFR